MGKDQRNANLSFEICQGKVQDGSLIIGSSHRLQGIQEIVDFLVDNVVDDRLNSTKEPHQTRNMALEWHQEFDTLDQNSLDVVLQPTKSGCVSNVPSTIHSAAIIRATAAS